MTAPVEVAVIGGGQAGLAISCYDQPECQGYMVQTTEATNVVVATGFFQRPKLPRCCWMSQVSTAPFLTQRHIF